MGLRGCKREWRRGKGEGGVACLAGEVVGKVNLHGPQHLRMISMMMMMAIVIVTVMVTVTTTTEAGPHGPASAAPRPPSAAPPAVHSL